VVEGLYGWVESELTRMSRSSRQLSSAPQLVSSACYPQRFYGGQQPFVSVEVLSHLGDDV